MSDFEQNEDGTIRLRRRTPEDALAHLSAQLAAERIAREKAEKEREELRTQLDAKWIKCSERMPPVGTRFLTAMSKECRGLVSVAENEQCQDKIQWGRWCLTRFVTHWQPLPASPDTPTPTPPAPEAL